MSPVYGVHNADGVMPLDPALLRRIPRRRRRRTSRRREVDAERHDLGVLIERLIARLDALDGDPDFEPDNDAEDTWDCELDPCDIGEPDSWEDEHSRQAPVSGNVLGRENVTPGPGPTERDWAVAAGTMRPLGGRKATWRSRCCVTCGSCVDRSRTAGLRLCPECMPRMYNERGLIGVRLLIYRKSLAFVGGLVPDYRIYMTDPNGKILIGEDFSCETDEQACDEARDRLGVFGRAEVWVGTRRVGIETLDLKSNKSVAI